MIQLISTRFEQCVLRRLARKVSLKYQGFTQMTYARSPSKAKSVCSLCAIPWCLRDNFCESPRNVQCSNGAEINSSCVSVRPSVSNRGQQKRT